MPESDCRRDAGRPRLDSASFAGAAVFAALLVFCAQAAAQEPPKPVRAPPSCRQAIAQSRMICVTSDDCQREISEVLRVCNSSHAASCVQARDDVRTQCTSGAPWYGTRGCEAALKQVAHYCGR